MKQDIERQFLDAYEAHADAIFRFCYFRIRHRTLAEDLVQETFIRTWKYLREGKTIDSIRAFLYQTARNLIIDEVRRKKPNASLDDQLEMGIEPEGENEETILLQIQTRELLTKINLLPAPERQLILLRFVEGYKPNEIAKILEETPNTISVRIHRAKKSLIALCDKM